MRAAYAAIGIRIVRELRSTKFFGALLRISMPWGKVLCYLCLSNRKRLNPPQYPLPMDLHEERLKQCIRDQGIAAAHLSFAQSCHSVAEAAQAVHARPEDFVKNICMIDAQGNLINAIVKGEDRASTTAVAAALHIERPRLATAAEILAKTGYPCGGTPSFGYTATFLIDARVMGMGVVYSGGGSAQSLVKITPTELLRANRGKVINIRK